MKPLLIFPKQSVHARSKETQKFSPSPTGPGAGRQKTRLSPLFSQVQSELHQFTMSSSADGLQPERVLVLETIGSTENFANACKHIEGLNFLFDLQDKEADPDSDFYYEDESGEPKEKTLKNFVYLTMTNKAALDELIDHFNQYVANPDEPFKKGLAPLKNLFKQLSTLRLWDTQDRLRTTGVIEDWKERVKEGADRIPVEIELWYDAAGTSQSTKENIVREALAKIDGQVLSRCIIEDIAYHAILANIPISAIETLIDDNNTDVELFRCADIMYFHPVGQCVVSEPELGDYEQIDEDNSLQTISSEPIAALLDGWPLEHHQWLKDRILVDDPDGWSETYKPGEQMHGTSMASLIIHGDKHLSETPISRPLYVRPIMKPVIPSMHSELRLERIPEEVLPIDIIHRSIIRMFEGEGGEPPIAPHVKIINLSVADQNRLFDRSISPWARLIDWASWRYQIIFVISAGNHADSLNLGINTSQLESLSDSEKEEVFLNAMHEQQASRRLMSPAESINAITVGSLHTDGYEGALYPDQHDPFETPNMPSLINSISWGARRSVKPELLVPGGRQVYKNVNAYLSQSPAEMVPDKRTAIPPGQKVAVPGNMGSLNSTAYTTGTSNAAALTTRKLIQLYDVIDELYTSQHGHLLNPKYKAVLLKALLIHGAECEDNYTALEKLLNTQGIGGNIIRSRVARYLGYGHLNGERIENCEDYQATLLQCGTLSNDEQITYQFPLPSGLAAQTHLRRFIVTLAWFSPCSAAHDRYRQTRLFFEPSDFRDQLSLDERLNDHTMVRNGTVQHEILVGEKAAAFVDGDTLNINIKCMTDQMVQDFDIPYGIAVTLDNLEAKIPIYDEVKTSIDAIIENDIQQSIKN